MESLTSIAKKERIFKNFMPIFHWAFISGVGAYNTIHVALGTFQIVFLTNKNFKFLKSICIIIKQNPKCASF